MTQYKKIRPNIKHYNAHSMLLSSTKMLQNHSNVSIYAASAVDKSFKI